MSAFSATGNSGLLDCSLAVAFDALRAPIMSPYGHGCGVHARELLVRNGSVKRKWRTQRLAVRLAPSRFETLTPY